MFFKCGHVPARSVRCLVATLFLLSGCSTYSGQKLGLKDGKPVKPNGVPYVLVRADFSLTRTPPSEGEMSPNYTIAVSQEPDPAQRYTLNIDPVIFADPNFVMKLSSGGTLQGTTATITEQITTTITALGTFTANLIGALAIVADKDSVRKQITFNLKATDASGQPCNEATDALLPPLAPAPSLKVGEFMTQRINAFKDDDEFTNLFHYVTEKERLCLKNAREKLVNIGESTHKQAIAEWEQERKTFLKDNSIDKEFAERLTGAVESEDTKSLQAIQNEIADDTDANGGLTARAMSRQNLFIKAVPAAVGISTALAKTKLDFFIGMESPTWRARNLLYLEREIDRITLFVLRNPQLYASNKSAFDYHLTVLQRQRAATAGVSDLFERSLSLSKFIESIKNKSVEGGIAPATVEYSTARMELDSLITQIDLRRARLLADAKAPPAVSKAAPTVPFKDRKIARVRQADIDKSLVNDWFKVDGRTADDYVIVLEEMP